jgi:hypothetical protein
MFHGLCPSPPPQGGNLVLWRWKSLLPVWFVPHLWWVSSLLLSLPEKVHFLYKRGVLTPKETNPWTPLGRVSPPLLTCAPVACYVWPLGIPSAGCGIVLHSTQWVVACLRGCEGVSERMALLEPPWCRVSGSQRWSWRLLSPGSWPRVVRWRSMDVSVFHRGALLVSFFGHEE